MWKQDYVLRRHSAPINSIDISPDMVNIATGSSDRSVGITNIDTRQTTYLAELPSSVCCVAFSPLSTHLLSGSSDGQAILWDSNTGENVGSFKGHSHIVRSACWSTDGRFVVTGSNDQTAILWSLNRFTKRMQFTGLRGWVRDVKWSGNTIAVAGNDTQILLFDDRTGKVTQTIETGTKSDIASVSFHHTGNCLAAGSGDQYIRIWDLRTSTLLQRHAAHTSGITKVAFNPYTDDLLSVSHDGFAKLWNLQAGSVVATYHQHESSVLGCCWVPSARGFVTCGEDRRICGYKMETKPVDPASLDLDGGDIMVGLMKLQNQINGLTDLMKSLDKRLLIQEEKLEWLSDISEPINRATKRSRESRQ